MDLEEMEFKELINLALQALNQAEDSYRLTDEETYRIKISREILSKVVEE